MVFRLQHPRGDAKETAADEEAIIAVEADTESFEGTWTLREDKLETTTVSKNGKQLSSPRAEVLHYEDGRLSYQDAEVPFPFLVLSRQG